MQKKRNHIYGVRTSLICALIGLARAAEGNRNRPDDAAHRALLLAMQLAGDSKPDIQALAASITALHAAKARLIPRCAVCTKPCGRNDDFDWIDFNKQSPALQALKLDILANLLHLAVTLANCHNRILFDAGMEFLYCGLFEWGQINEPETLNDLRHKTCKLQTALELNEGKKSENRTDKMPANGRHVPGSKLP